MDRELECTDIFALQNLNFNEFIYYLFSCSKKPVAEVKPTKSNVQPSAPLAASTTVRKRSVGTNLKNKRSSEMGPNFTPFNEPQRALQLVSTQINSSEWYT